MSKLCIFKDGRWLESGPHPRVDRTPGPRVNPMVLCKLPSGSVRRSRSRPVVALRLALTHSPTHKSNNQHSRICTQISINNHQHPPRNFLAGAQWSTLYERRACVCVRVIREQARRVAWALRFFPVRSPVHRTPWNALVIDWQNPPL